MPNIQLDHASMVTLLKLNKIKSWSLIIKQLNIEGQNLKELKKKKTHSRVKLG